MTKEISYRGSTWCSEIKYNILKFVHMYSFYENKLVVNLKDVEDVLLHNKQDWYDNVRNFPKLRTYV